MSEKDVIETYRTRSQIEFNFRDAKQHAGLCNSQSRNLDRLDFNFKAFLFERFIAVFSISPNRNLNEKLFKEFIEVAAIATWSYYWFYLIY